MLDNFLAQLRGNPRLRWGIAIIVAVLWLYGILLLKDSLQERSMQYRMDGKRVAQMRAELAQPEWLARVEQANVLSTQLEGRLWQAPTQGLAQAAFQDWLNTAVRNAGVARAQVAVTVIDETPATQQGDAGATPADLWKIKAKLSFDFSAQSLIELLRMMESNDKQIAVGTLVVHKEPTPHVEMELYGYFQKQAAQLPGSVKQPEAGR